VLSNTGDQQITLSKLKFCVIDLIRTIADFAVKPFSPNTTHTHTHTQVGLI